MMNVSRGAIQRINENDAEAATGANFIMQVLYCDDFYKALHCQSIIYYILIV
jgi:hypothetical protein